MGRWPLEAERFVDDDGVTAQISRCASMSSSRKSGERISFDFSGSDDQAVGLPTSGRRSCGVAIAYCLIALVDPHMFINSGLMRAFELKVREGSVMNPRYPHR